MYQEPGVYLNLTKSGALNPPVSGGRIPLIIGSGPNVLRETVSIVRSSSGQVDTLPVNATNIEVVGTIEGVNSYVSGAGNDYVFNVSTPNQITWNAGKGPVAGSAYYITLTHNVDPDLQYQPQICYTEDDIDKYYGPDIMIDDASKPCKISLAARIALRNGASAVYVLQVKATGAAQTASSSDYQSALDNYASFLTDIWRIVPVDVDTQINGVIDAHVFKMSSSDERLERTEIYGAAYTTTLATAADVLTTVGGYADSKDNARLNVIYPDSASIQLSDGKFYTVNAPFLCAAIAGKESASGPQVSRTRMAISGFNTLGGVKLRRSEMNSLAEHGVMILTQSVPGADIVIRHQLTTDMSSVQNREISITDISDTTSKFLRSSCEPYIGKFNITPDMITRVEGTINSAFKTLADKNIILKGTILSIMQDADNPDRLIIKVRVTVPYPCNFIELDVELG